MRLMLRPALSTALLIAPAASAQTIGPDQAQALERQLKDGLTSLLGLSAKPPELPFRINADRDHYTLSWPIRGLDSRGGDAALTATLRPLNSGRWSIEAVRTPPEGVFTMTIPRTGDRSPTAPVKVSFTIGQQDTHGVIDPALAAVSTLHSEVGRLAVTTDAPNQHQEQRIDRWRMDATLKPTQTGRLDLATDATMNGWQWAAKTENSTPVAAGVQSMHATGRVDGINRERAAALIAATGGLIGALPDATHNGANTAIPAMAMAQLHFVVAALQDIVAAVSLQETMEGVQLEIAGMGGLAIKHLDFAFGGEAPEGKLHAWIDIRFDEPDSPTLPPTIAAYLPRHFEIRPSLSGIRTADLQKLALDATGAKADTSRFTPDISAILAHGPASLGVEMLSFDLGPARFEGTGQFVVPSPGTWRGEAHLSATGLDELMMQAHDNPDLQQALPGLIMLRGLAKPDGERLVWDVASDGPNFTVNGMDLSQLGGGKSRPKPPTGKPDQPSKR